MERLSILLGDVIGSRKIAEQLWKPALKEALSKHRKDAIAYEIFEGDSFYLVPNDARNSLKIALSVKLALRKIPDADIRIAITMDSNDEHPCENIKDTELFHRGMKLLKRLKPENRELAVSDNIIEFDHLFNEELKTLCQLIKSSDARYLLTLEKMISSRSEQETSIPDNRLLPLAQNLNQRLQGYFNAKTSEKIK